MATSSSGDSPQLRASKSTQAALVPSPPTERASQQCPLLELSAELRNTIWEMAYTFETSPGHHVNPLVEAGPTPALLLTCRQIKSEATGFFEAVPRRYWEDNFFEVRGVYDQEQSEDFTSQLLQLDNGAVDRMENVHLELCRYGHCVSSVPIPGTNHSAWEFSASDDDELMSGLCVVGS